MKHRPITAFAKLGGLYFLPRTLDKIRKHARGELHEEHHEFLGKGFDGRLCHFLGIGYDALRARTLAGGTDEEILAWCLARGGARSEEEILVWNHFMMKRGWRDDANPRLRQRIAEGAYESLPIMTMFDYIDFDEGRDPVGAQAWAPAG